MTFWGENGELWEMQWTNSAYGRSFSSPPSLILSRCDPVLSTEKETILIPLIWQLNVCFPLSESVAGRWALLGCSPQRTQGYLHGKSHKGTQSTVLKMPYKASAFYCKIVFNQMFEQFFWVVKKVFLLEVYEDIFIVLFVINRHPLIFKRVLRLLKTEAVMS